MSNENYSPDEIRLLDEFAVAFVPKMQARYVDDAMAPMAYKFATAMIAERRKRVQSQPVRDPLYPQPKCQRCGKPFAPGEARIKPANEFGAGHCLACEPVFPLRPQPEQQPSGELTEEAVRRWQCEAERVEITWGGYRVDGIEIDRAVALMREGLAAKESSSNSLALMRTAEACTAMATMRAEKAEKERDEAKKAEGGAS